MLPSSFCDCSGAYILVGGTIIVVRAGEDSDRNNKEAVFKDFSLFPDCISKINNTQADKAKNLDVVMPMYNLIEQSDRHSKTSESLSQFCRDEPDNVITESESFKFKSKFLDNTNQVGITNKK